MSEFEGLTVEALAGAIAACPETQIKAVQLLREHRPAAGSLFPAKVDRAAYIEATKQMIQYMHDCAALAQQIRALPAQASSSPESEDFAL